MKAPRVNEPADDCLKIMHTTEKSGKNHNISGGKNCAG